MKKMFFRAILGIAIIGGVSFYNYGKSESTTLSTITLDDVEALGACEVSADPSRNKGYCTTNYGGSGETCVTSGSGSEVRCSGNA